MKFKRVISVVLCIMMLLGNAGIVVNSAAATVVASGECGENATWALDSGGVLTISGYGEMDNYYMDLSLSNVENAAPWTAEYFNTIEKVVIEDGITCIGDYAFFYCYNLKEVVLPDSIISIGDGAFLYCMSMAEITLPASVEELGVGAFYFNGFRSITIPASVTNFGAAAFMGCPNLISVTIEDGLGRIGTMAFAACESLWKVKIPDSVTNIGAQAFASCMSLESVSIGSGLKSIGMEAFAECPNLKSFTVDENNSYFSSLDGVLYNKDKTTLEIYPAGKEDSSFEVPDGVKTIGLSAFSGCSFENLRLPVSVTTILDNAFYDCEALKSIIVDENNINYCSDSGVLYNNDKTELICYPSAKEASVFEIPYGVKNIGYEAFYDAENLVNVIIPESVISIDDYAFSSCSALEAINIPESVVSIGDSAFSGCESLVNINIPDSVTSIGEAAFTNNAYAYDENNWENGALYIDNHLIDVNGDATGELVVKEGTITVTGDVFDYASATSITIPASVRGISVGLSPWRSEILEKISVDASNEYYCSDDGVLYDKNKSTLIYYPASKQNSSFTLPGCVKTIEDYAFGYSSFLESVTIPGGVEKIGNYAFDGCRGLSEIIIPDSVTSIGLGAFRDTAYYNDESNWQEDALYIGNHLVNTKVHNLLGFSSVDSLNIKDGTKTFAGELFAAAPLTSITIPGSVECIGEIAFYLCEMLKSVIIENGVNVIGDGAFFGCSSLEDITIPESVEGIGVAAFFGCDSLERIIILNPECEISEDLMDETMAPPGSATIPDTIVIYGYKDSTAQKYAEKYGNTFIALDGEDTTVEINVSDNENSGIQLDFSENTFDDSQGTITLEIKKDTTQSQYLLMDFFKVTAWNMTFYNEAGEEIQPNAPVTVKMPIPEDYNGGTLMVLHLDPQTNQSSMVDFIVEDGFVVFEASSFSVYALVDTSSEIEEEPTVEPDAPSDEPDEPAAPSCDHLCHKSGFVGIIWKIVRFFWRLFNMNPVCECGVAHY